MVNAASQAIASGTPTVLTIRKKDGTERKFELRGNVNATLILTGLFNISKPKEKVLGLKGQESKYPEAVFDMSEKDRIIVPKDDTIYDKIVNFLEKIANKVRSKDAEAGKADHVIDKKDLNSFNSSGVPGIQYIPENNEVGYNVLRDTKTGFRLDYNFD